MDETPKGPDPIPPAASNEPGWGPPNTHYPPPEQQQQSQSPPPESATQGYPPPAYPPSGYPPPGNPPPGYAAPGNPPPGYPPPGFPPPAYVSAAPLSTNIAAALCYITFIPAVIFLVLEPYKRDSFIRFHAWQCIVLSLVDIAGDFLFLHLGFFGLLVRGLLGLLLFIFWLISIIKASQGERYHVPLVGELAETLSARI